MLNVRKGKTFLLAGVICFSLILLFSCASLNQVQTKVTSPEGREWTVLSKPDAIIEIEDGKTKDKLKVDNRGRPSTFETMLQFMLMRTDINLGSEDRD